MVSGLTKYQYMNISIFFITLNFDLVFTMIDVRPIQPTIETDKLMSHSTRIRVADLGRKTEQYQGLLLTS